ncbi:hypothetical protein [Oceaniradius stylonematis]|uniref:hypothetical protein n=1 Tax=Oceaniradius stylonematis TaxID=2184161 RepID=UPI00273EFFAE|nr:hypothetical protein [Oceaniradius stylonematis]
MTNALALAILLNLPGGTQIEVARVPMPADQCLVLQQAIWNGPNVTAWTDELGPAPMVDAACIPLTMEGDAR